MWYTVVGIPGGKSGGRPPPIFSDSQNCDSNSLVAGHRKQQLILYTHAHWCEIDFSRFSEQALDSKKAAPLLPAQA